MRWKSVAVLVAVLSVAGAQVASIDNDINSITTVKPTTPKPIEEVTSTTNELNNLREVPINHDDDSDAVDSDAGDQNNRNDNNSTSNEVENDNGDSLDEGFTPDTVVDSIENNQSNSNDSTDAEAPGSNENEQDVSDQVDVENSNESEIENENVTEGGVTVNPNSNENGGEESVETEQPNSDENVASRSSEHVSREVGEIIETEGGLVQGYYLHGDLGIRSYIDIPYGTFSGLFQAPSKASSWEHVHIERVHSKRCPQINENGDYAGDTDCLTLSVFAPNNVENAAVLFHIYDGEFHVDSADPNFYGPEYLVPKGIILVLANYRLGALGFLCLDNDVAPGNAGLKDLTLALEWTRNNIAKFGGNPSNIVVSGDGTSGALAGYLALSPISRPYVSGVITESGSMLAHWAIDRNPDIAASLLRDTLQQEITNILSAEVLVLAANKINFRPCIENNNEAFIKQTPWQILDKEDEKIEIPFIIGSANHAGIQEAMEHTTESLSELNENFEKFLPNDLKFKDGEEKDIAQKIKKQYFGENNIASAPIEHISLCYTDAYYLGPSIRVSRALVAAGAKVYFFEFSFFGELNRILASLTTSVQGAARGDLVSYTFTQEGDMVMEGTDEERTVNLITDLWVSFLKTGVPSADGVSWSYLTAVAESEEEWLSMDREMEQKKGLHEDRLALWTDVYNKHFVENMATDLRSKMYLIVLAIVLLCLRKYL